ncbi:MAG: flavin reductase family protein [Nocardioides sp.]|uniref:flavin reductase family protein n=1 Tax=Nocardioides sp. TaxID=35761 RepID=UPI0039E39A3F
MNTTNLTELPDPTLLRNAFSHFPSGVAALAARIEGAPTALVASSFTVGVSLEPPLVLFAVQNSSTTWPTLRRAPRIGISVLGETHDQACRQLASKNGDRFAGLDLAETTAGALFISGAPIWLECEIEAEVPAGDHHVILLRIEALQTQPHINPLVFHQSGFRRLEIAS